jgi:hypothetical protein
MKHEDLIQELQGLAGQLGVAVRYEKGDFDGGFCILKAEKILVVNKRLTPVRKASVLALGMHAIGIDDVYVKPALRAYIEDEIAKTLRKETNGEEKG